MRVIVLEAFKDGKVDHPYGEEFDAPSGAKLDGWLAKGLVRVDDRAARPTPESAPKGKRPSGSPS